MKDEFTRFDEIVNQILIKREEMPAEQSLLAGISGIDASGKGFVTNKMSQPI